MADPCTTDTDYIALDTTGTPAVLEAVLRNPEETFSATQGDYSVHNVNDHNVVHTQTQSATIDNSAGTAPCRGIVVVTFDPVWIAPGGDGEQFVWHSQLLLDGVVVDERNKNGQVLLIPQAALSNYAPMGVCVGQVNIAAGDTVAVIFRKSIENTGSADDYSFLMGGDKLVVQMGY